MKTMTKARKILDYLLSHSPEAGPTEVAKALQMNKTTAFRLLSALADAGFVDEAKNGGKYRLGVRLLELGTAVQERLGLRREALPYLERLAAISGQTTFLSIRVDFNAICLERIPGAHVEVMTFRPGTSLPLNVGAGPRVLLAGLSDAELKAYLARGQFATFTAHTVVKTEDLRREVEVIRTQGYAMSRDDITFGISAIGAPVFDALGNVVAAISIAGLNHSFEQRAHDFIKFVLSAAEDVSKRLGWDPKMAIRSH